MRLKNDEKYKHSFSYGIIEVSAEIPYDIDEIIKKVDQKMYQNKSLKRTP